LVGLNEGLIDDRHLAIVCGVLHLKHVDTIMFYVCHSH